MKERRIKSVLNNATTATELVRKLISVPLSEKSEVTIRDGDEELLVRVTPLPSGIDYGSNGK